MFQSRSGTATSMSPTGFPREARLTPLKDYLKAYKDYCGYKLPEDHK
jgi:hypothetical protein